MRCSFSAAAIAFLLLARPATGQAPPGRAHHSLFYDEARERILLSGGSAVHGRNYELLDDLWSFDGTKWTRLAQSNDRISGTRVGVDAQKRIYSFGGFRDSAVGDLRVLENDQWRRVAVHPEIAVPEPGFAYDAARGKFVAFGATTGPRGTLPFLWEYDGARWIRSSATPPPPRFAHAMVYDARRKKIVVVGGMGPRVGEQPAPMLGDTWEFNGSAWKEIRVAGPPPRLGAGSAYDSKRGLVMIFGGANHQGAFNDLWSWDGTSWKKLAETGPEPRVMGYIAYDKKRDRIVLFGGRRASPDNTDLNDTWEWDGTAWHKIGGA